MEYAPLTWSNCSPSYLNLLDKVQARAQRLIRLKALPDQLLPPLQPLQQRRDVAGLCVVYKTHKQHVPYLAALRQPWARPHGHTARPAATRDHQLIVPSARMETSLRSFLPRYTRMWNHMVQQTQLHSTSSLQTFKRAFPLAVYPGTRAAAGGLSVCTDRDYCRGEGPGRGRGGMLYTMNILRLPLLYSANGWPKPDEETKQKSHVVYRGTCKRGNCEVLPSSYIGMTTTKLSRLANDLLAT
ncbi:hypothetical protein GWK47_015845 [Chionoecetes opilio]|uniref:Uncharacterized protein n=1 Tax=Chionoecetes opilio TaxID=41210 RepID=A0A8J4XS38_CHIOP|nr:hypothetical protein GWK47_015845 [Chionoecetes opilio]